MNNEIIEIGALKVRDGKVSERFMEFIKPQELISPAITGLTGISNDMVASLVPPVLLSQTLLIFAKKIFS